MKTIILAGGWGTRLEGEDERIPKPMVPIGNQPILWHIMKIYSHYGFNEFIIVSNKLVATKTGIFLALALLIITF